jgi:hypothetical protein
VNKKDTLVSFRVRYQLHLFGLLELGDRKLQVASYKLQAWSCGKIGRLIAER